MAPRRRPITSISLPERKTKGMASTAAMLMARPTSPSLMPRSPMANSFQKAMAFCEAM